MRIVFITDLHLAAEGERPKDVDVRANFLKALEKAKALRPACVVLGGDLCYDSGDAAVYDWMRPHLDALPCQYHTIAGNHDDATLLAESFRLTHHLQNGELYYALPLEGTPTLFLDTSKGTMSDRQWAWLEQEFRALRDHNVLVFMHHPPVPVGAQFMDANYAFKQPDKFYELVRELPCHVMVVCGHYHAERVVQRGKLLSLVTPSTFYQIAPDPAEFTVDHYRPALREINVTTQGFTSVVHYF